ncbi:hypothetical protein [Streptomyces sp. NPDC005486]|uniref:hypothetical protein n=1 Tax=Streptomyces sp. NPDC005486 TaxID=3155345 RepID=UPI0033BB7D94
MRAVVPDAGAAAFGVLGDVGVAEAGGFAVLEGGLVVVGVAAVLFAVFEAPAVLGFCVVGFGVGTAAVGVCDAAGTGSPAAVTFPPRPQPACAARSLAASLHQPLAVFFSAL